MNPSKLSGVGKIAAVFLALVVGMEAYARWTNQGFNIDLIPQVGSPNVFGQALMQVQGTVAAAKTGHLVPDGTPSSGTPSPTHSISYGGFTPMASVV